jgi:hypothetical protein
MLTGGSAVHVDVALVCHLDRIRLALAMITRMIAPPRRRLLFLVVGIEGHPAWSNSVILMHYKSGPCLHVA